MNSGRTVFAQLMDFLPLVDFRRCVERYRGEYKVQSFSCLDQFLCLAFAQLTGSDSLREIVVSLRAHQQQLYHMGFRGRVCRSTLADANEQRDWRIYRDFAQGLIHTARALYRDEPLGIELVETATYAFDSTTIDLCLQLFPWAPFRRHKGAVKLHTLLDLRGSIPVNVFVTAGRVNDVNLLDELLFEPGAFYLLDRGYVDFARLYTVTQACAFFVTRAERNTRFRRCCSHPTDPDTGVRSDQSIRLTGPKSSRRYPAELRRIHYFDIDTEMRLIFLTNNFALPALIIAQLYRARWQVELFFRWIKQHLRIRAFYGTSENAVKTQVWVAIATYVLVAILKKRLAVDLTLHTILRILDNSLFEKTPILQGLFNFNEQTIEFDPCMQLELFHL